MKKSYEKEFLIRIWDFCGRLLYTDILEIFMQ